MPTFCRHEGECSKRLRGEREWRFFVSEKCLLKTRLLRARVFSLRFFCLFFSRFSMCVSSPWPADIVFFGVFGPRRKRATHRPKDVSNILSKVSPHKISHLIITDIKRTRRAFTLSRERESLGALNNNNNNNNDSFFIVSAFFFKSFYRARARARIIYARRVLILITRRMALLFPMWCDDDRRKKNTRVSPFSRERRRQKRRIAKDNTVVAVVCRAR